MSWDAYRIEWSWTFYWASLVRDIGLSLDFISPLQKTSPICGIGTLTSIFKWYLLNTCLCIRLEAEVRIITPLLQTEKLRSPWCTSSWSHISSCFLDPTLLWHQLCSLSSTPMGWVPWKPSLHFLNRGKPKQRCGVTLCRRKWGRWFSVYSVCLLEETAHSLPFS